MNKSKRRKSLALPDVDFIKLTLTVPQARALLRLVAGTLAAEKTITYTEWSGIIETLTEAVANDR